MIIHTAAAGLLAAVTIALLPGVAGGAAAQESIVTAYPILMAGEPSGCGLTFESTFPAPGDRSGEPLRAAGNLTMWSRYGTSLTMLKFGVSPVADPTSARDAPTAIYLVNGDRTNAAEVIASLRSAPGQPSVFRVAALSMGEQTREAIAGVGRGYLRLGYTTEGEPEPQTVLFTIPAGRAAAWRECQDVWGGAMVDGPAR